MAAGSAKRDIRADAGAVPPDSPEAIKLWLSERFAQESDPNVILHVVAETLGRYLGVSRVGYGEIVPGEDWITIPLDWTDGISTMVGRRPLYRRSTLVPEYERGRTLAVPDTELIEVTPEERQSLRDTRCRAFVAVPLIHDGAFVALFSANHHEPREWTADEILLIQQTGARTWSALQHARTIARLRQSEDEFRLLAENIPGICWLSGPDGVATWMNRHGLDFYGSLEEVAARPDAVIHPDDRAVVGNLWNRARRTGSAMEARVRLLGQDGQYRTFLTRSAPIRDAAGDTARWCGIQFDLTDQEARERHAGFFRALSDAIRTETEADAVLDMVAAMLREHLGVDRVLYAEVDDGPDGPMLSVERDPDARLGEPSRAGRYRLDTGFGALIAAWRAGMTSMSEDLLVADTVSTPELRRMAETLGIRAGLDVPLVKGGRLVAVLMVHHGVPRAWTREEKALVEDVAERTWSTVTRARAEAALRRRQSDQAFLIDWSDHVRSETCPETILALTLERLGRHLGASRVTYSSIGIDGGTYTIVSEWGPGEPPVAGYSYPASNLSAIVRAAYLAGELMVSDDLSSDQRFGLEARRRFLENRVCARIGIPLSRGGEVRAIMAVDQNRPRTWNPQEVRLAGEVADRMWTMLERARAEQALKEREQHRAMLLDWSDRTRGLAMPDAILDTTLERLGSHLGVSRASYLQSDATGRLFTVVAEWTDGVSNMVGTSFSLDQVSEAINRQWEAGEIVRYDDVVRDPRMDDDLAQAHLRIGTAAFASAPLVQEGRLRSALSIQNATPRRWTDAEIELLRDLAERAWIALDRARATTEVRRRERDRAFLLDWSDQLVGEVDAGRIADITLERLVTHLDTARANLAEGAVADGRFRIVAEWRRATGRRAPERSRDARNAVSGGVHQDYLNGDVVVVADVRADPRFDAATADAYAAVDAVAFLGVPMLRGGEVQAVLSVQQGSPRDWQPAEIQLLRDVANRFWVLLDRARAQEELRRRERDQAFLLEWSDSVRGQSIPRAILGETLARLGAHLGCSRLNYGEATTGDDGLVLLQEWRRGVVELLGTTFPFSALGEAVIADHRTGRHLAVDDVRTHPLFADVQGTYAAAEVRAVLSVPLVEDGRLLAVLSAQHPHPHEWTGSEIRLMREVADRTWAVLARAQSEARLADSEAQLAAFMDNAPVAMHLTDADGRYVRINPEFAAAVRRSPEELPGLKAADLFPRHVADAMTRLEAEALERGTASAELGAGTEGTYQSILSIVFPVTSSGPARAGGFTIDLTDRKAAEEALRRSREALYQTEKLSALGSLLAGVSHELNNPLSIVVAQAVMMERQSKGTELAERAFKIRKAADRCARIVQTFLAMARQKRPERAPTDLNQVVAAAIELTEYGLRTDGIVLERALDPCLPWISADADQIHQIIVNLVINAQHAMTGQGSSGQGSSGQDEPGTRRITVSTAPGQEPLTVVLEIADTGPGVPEAARRRIFEPFYTTKAQGEGTGVGLSFSQGLAEAHGGRLALVQSGPGATFRLTLPIEEDRTLPALEPALPPVARPTRRALVIDDEGEIAESLADFLELEGYGCEVAVGGAAGRALLARGDWDLVVSDLRMPEIDGPALHAFVVAERPELASRMAFTTGDTLGAAAARFLTEIHRPVLEKPFTPETVRRFLDQLDAPDRG